MRIHEKGQLFDGIKYRDGKDNLGRNSNINEMNYIYNDLKGNHILNNKAKHIKIEINRSEDDSIKSSKAKNKANPNNEDIMMKDELKQTKIKK